MFVWHLHKVQLKASRKKAMYIEYRQCFTEIVSFKGIWLDFNANTHLLQPKCYAGLMKEVMTWKFCYNFFFDILTAADSTALLLTYSLGKQSTYQPALSKPRRSQRLRWHN